MKYKYRILAVVIFVFLAGCAPKPVSNCCKGAGTSCASGPNVTKTLCDAVPGEFIEGKSCDRGGECTL